LTRQKPSVEELREAKRGRSIREVAQIFAVSYGTMQRWLKDVPYIPRFEGYGHGAPPIKTRPGRALTRKRKRLIGEDERDRPGYVWDARGKSTRPYLPDEAQAVITQGTKFPRELTLEEAGRAEAAKQEDRYVRRAFEKMIVDGVRGRGLHPTSLPGWTVDSTPPWRRLDLL